MPDVAGDDGRPNDRVVLAERARAAGSFLEVGDQHVTAAIGCAHGWRARSDAEEVVHVNVAAFRLCSTLCDERDCVDASCASTRRYTRPFALEPGLDREIGCAEAWCRAEGHVVIRAIEVQRSPGGGSRWGWRRGGCRRGPRQWETGDPDGAVGSGAVDAATGRVGDRSPGAFVHAPAADKPR